MSRSISPIHNNFLKLNPWLVQLCLLLPWLLAFLLKDSNHRNLAPQWDAFFLLLAYIVLAKWLWSLLFFFASSQRNCRLYRSYKLLVPILVMSLVLGRNFGNRIPGMLLLLANILSIPLLILVLLLPFVLMYEVARTQEKPLFWSTLGLIISWPITVGIVHGRILKLKS